MTDSKQTPGAGGASAPSEMRDVEKHKFRELVEQARQNVKPIVKQELANETITEEMMAFRFK